MKKALYIIGIALAIAGCTKSEITENTPSSGEISFSAGLTTRVSSEDDCEWSKGEYVGIFTDQTDDSSNMMFQITDAETGAMTADASVSALYALTTGKRTYYAYHPYSETLQNDTEISYNITSDQSNYLLYATTATNDTDVTLQFTHQLPKVTFNLTAGGVDVTSLTGAKVLLTGANSAATFDVKSGEFMVEETRNISLTLDDNDSVTAYLLPTEDVDDNVQLWITSVDSKNNTFIKSLETENWESGSSYVYDILVGEADIELKSDGVYYINSAKGLRAFADLVNGVVNTTAGTSGNITFSTTKETDISGVLTRNIDLSDICYADEDGDVNWTPIGLSSSASNIYSGTFDGDGYLVSGLYINNPASDYQGLFGANSGTISNLGVSGSVEGKGFVGGVVGYNSSDGTIINCYNTSDVSGTNYVGGVVGWSNGDTVVNVYNTGSVSGTSNVGGLLGYNGGTLKIGYNVGAVSLSSNSSSSTIGGVVGSNSSNVSECYWNTDVYSGNGVYDTTGSSSVTGYSTAIMTGSEYVTGQTYYFYELLNTKADEYNNANSDATQACQWKAMSNYPTLDFGVYPATN